MARTKRLTKQQIADCFAIFAETIEPKSDLQWNNPLNLLIAVVLSAQATDVGVNAATRDLFERCQTCEDYLALGEENLREAIKTIGLYRNKAKHVIGLCEQLLANHDGRVPDSREALQALPGVGRKTANVVLNVCFRHPTLAVDTHIQRVSNRMGFCETKTPDATEQAMLKKIPAQHLLHAHHYLILHGRYTCKARKPLCGSCRVHACCNFPDKGPAPAKS